MNEDIQALRDDLKEWREVDRKLHDERHGAIMKIVQKHDEQLDDVRLWRAHLMGKMAAAASVIAVLWTLGIDWVKGLFHGGTVH